MVLQSLSLVGSGSNDLEARARGGGGKKNPVKPTPPKRTPAKAAAVKKAPAGKPVANKKLPAKALAKKTPAKVPAGKKGGKVCPAKKPTGKKTKRSLYRRDVTSHPSGATSFTMFHGAQYQDWADEQKTGIDVRKTHHVGDYHVRGGTCEGGFYLTDSLFAAAQFVCFQGKQPPPAPKMAYVNEYLWTPPPGLRHKAYTTAGSAVDDLAGKTDCKNYDLLEGPMNNAVFDLDLHKDFYQYAITTQATVAGLAFVKQYEIPCANVLPGKDIDSIFYQMGQKANPEFWALVNLLDGNC